MKWKEHQRYRKVDDWVFASNCRRGRKPYWGQAILRKYIRPRAQELGIEKNFGWHTLRHTYSTLLRSVGTEFKVMQELLRHPSLRSTLDVYTPSHHAGQTRSPSRRGVVRIFFAIANGGAHLIRQKVGEIGSSDVLNWGAKRAHFGVPLHPIELANSPIKPFGMYGGDDGARTRDLCRDRNKPVTNWNQGERMALFSALRNVWQPLLHPYRTYDLCPVNFCPNYLLGHEHCGLACCRKGFFCSAQSTINKSTGIPLADPGSVRGFEPTHGDSQTFFHGARHQFCGFLQPRVSCLSAPRRTVAGIWPLPRLRRP